MDNSSVEKLPLLYVRHIMDANASMFRDWLKEGLVVLHYEDDSPKDRMSVDPEDFSGPGRKVMKRLKDYCQTGALVVADFNDYGFRTFLIGVLPPNSKIEPRKEKIENIKSYRDGFAYYRTVGLQGAVQLNYSDSRARPMIVLQPRQGNVVNWSIGNISTYVKYLYKALLHGRSLPLDYPPEKHPFTDYQWEVLCSEFLRLLPPSDEKIDYLLTPVGRTMKDIDIDGANKEAHVLAQVSLTTVPSEIERKLSSLELYLKQSKAKTKKTVLVYFGPEEIGHQVISGHRGVKFFSVGQVFSRLNKVGIITDMLHQTE
jgi:hypothetical protein